MPALRRLWVTLNTMDVNNAGTDANLFLDFQGTGKTVGLPDQPNNDIEQGRATSYIFNVNNLGTEDFVPGTVVLRNDNTGDAPGWRCASVLILGIGEDGLFYPLVAMSDVDRWLAADEPEGLTMSLDILDPNEIGVI